MAFFISWEFSVYRKTRFVIYWLWGSNHLFQYLIAVWPCMCYLPFWTSVQDIDTFLRFWFRGFGYIPINDIAGSNGILIFNFWRNFLTVFHNSYTYFVFSTTLYKGSNISTSLPTLITFKNNNNSHSSRCEVILHCGFYFHFSNDLWCWNIFIYLLAMCKLLREMSFQIFCPLCN